MLRGDYVGTTVALSEEVRAFAEHIGEVAGWLLLGVAPTVRRMGPAEAAQRIH